MFDFILYAVLFFLGTLTKLILIPIYLFSGTTYNTSFNTLTKRLIYFFYLVFNYILMFAIGSYLVANNMINWFIALWFFLILMDVGVFVQFYNTAGNILGAHVAFVVLVRELLFAVISFVLICVYYAADYETHMVIYGNLIWGFGAAKILDAFPKFYIFGNYVNELNTLIPFRKRSSKKYSSSSSTTDPIDAILNAINVIMVMILSVFTAFFGSNIYTILLAIIYFLYVVGYFVYQRMK